MKIIQPLISAALLATLVAIGYGITTTWRHDPLAGQEKKAEEAGAKPAPAPPAQPPIRFNPVPPAVLPDLKTGYIFSEARTAADKKEEALTGKTTEGVNIKEAFYVGSILFGEIMKGMVAYPSAAAPRPQGQAPSLARTGGSGMKQMLVEVGDKLGGYTVSSIEADRIIFKKDAETVEKFLKDPEKKRTVPPATQAPPAGRQAGGSRVKTIGGAEAAAPATSKPVPAKESAPQAPPEKLSTPVPPAAKTPRTQAPAPAASPQPAPAPPPAPSPSPSPAPARKMSPEEIEQMESEMGKGAEAESEEGT